MRKSSSSAGGFTLVELLVVVAIIALLLAILFPSLHKAKYQAKVVVCSSVLKGIGRAMISYAQGNRGSYPMAAEPNTDLLGYDDWPYTEWPRSWALKEKAYDLRPIYRDYLGGSLDKYMKCPMTTKFFAERDLDTYVHSGRVLTSYMLYATNNANQKFFRFSADDKTIVSSRVDRPWSPISDPDTRFTYIASDVAFGNLAWHGGRPSGTGGQLRRRRRADQLAPRSQTRRAIRRGHRSADQLC